MTEVVLSGLLVCRDAEEVARVETHLPAHLERTRTEPGCLSFEVTRTDDPLVWRVEEHFADAASFRAHQERLAGSEWSRRTAGIERRDYTVSGLDED